jgi:diguanylate cyclase (GGDEF)-like protein
MHEPKLTEDTMNALPIQVAPPPPAPRHQGDGAPICNRIFVALIAAQFLVAVGMLLGNDALHHLAANAIAARQSIVSWRDRAALMMPFLLLGTLLCMIWIRQNSRRQVLERRRTEEELRQERTSLERRIESRTAELKSEVQERLRAEQLNRGRNQLLEMLARDEPTQHIFQVLVDILAHHRTVWGCALHLVDSDQLVLAASSDLRLRLVRHLEQLAPDQYDAPEAAALARREIVISDNLEQHRKPWTELLRANGVQAVWSAPFFTADRSPLGTLTIYSRLQCRPTDVELELLESHCQMAALVLERCRLQNELKQHAYHDNLTGLPNRRLGQDRLDNALLRARRNGQNVAVLWLDLNKYKQINDVHGHAAGDLVLVEVARRLTVRLRESDTVARMGGDEFMVLLEGVHSFAVAETVAAALLQAIEVPIPFQDLHLNITASLGISLFPEHGQSSDELVRSADMAMYEAKFRSGGTRSFSPALDRERSEQRELESAMIHALEHGGFRLHFQPQCDHGGRIDAFEALLRFTHSTLGPIPPGRLIAVAEQSQLIIKLGTWVLREACRQSRQWQAEGLEPVRVAVNISSMQFARPEFAGMVSQILAETGLAPELLELELTESVLINDFAESARQLQRLKQIGVSIAIDDFGSGYSSLNYLHRLPIDRLKIDRSFIEVVNQSNGSLPIVEAIITMAQRLGLRVVGEGIETVEQMRILCENGCDLLQGFLFSRPVAPERAAELLEAKGVCQ